MGTLSEAEGHLTLVLQSAVSVPKDGPATEIRDAAIALEGAAADLLEWMTQNPSPNAGVNVAVQRACSAYQDAADVMAGMTTGDFTMTPESGEIARAAIEVAHKENWEATMAYVKAVGP